MRTEFVCAQCEEPTFAKLYQTHAGSLFCSRECVSAFRVRTVLEEEAKRWEYTFIHEAEAKK